MIKEKSMSDFGKLLYDVLYTEKSKNKKVFSKLKNLVLIEKNLNFTKDEFNFCFKIRSSKLQISLVNWTCLFCDSFNMFAILSINFWISLSFIDSSFNIDFSFLSLLVFSSSLQINFSKLSQLQLNVSLF